MVSIECPVCAETALSRFDLIFREGRCSACGARSRFADFGTIGSQIADVFAQAVVWFGVLVGLVLAWLLLPGAWFGAVLVVLVVAAPLSYPIAVEPDREDAATRELLDRRHAV